MCLPNAVKKETKKRIAEKNLQLLNVVQTIETLLSMFTYINVFTEHFASLSDDELAQLREDDISDRIAAQLEPQQRAVLFRQIFNNSGNTSEEDDE